MKIVPPRRASHTYVQQLCAPPETVVPLLCPVREADWIEGWDPLLVVSESGVAEPDCVFVTAAGESEAIWTITRHEPGRGFVEMVKVTPGVTVCRLTIEVRAAPGGAQAEVTYRHTSLGRSGDAFVEGFTEAAYCDFMQDWERRLNHFLRHGTAWTEADQTSNLTPCANGSSRE